jgi:predicted RND superfamily exporter protein
MSQQKPSVFDIVMSWCGQHVLRFPWTLLLMSFLLCGLSLQYTMNTLRIDTNTSEMLSLDLNSLHPATILTGATNVILDNPFNFANIIALPLLMGMGVDSGIHIVHRLHSGLNDHDDLLQTGTARGVIFNSVATLCSFFSLACTLHQGTASMGQLLAIGITFTLLCSLIVLPCFQHPLARQRQTHLTF